MLGVVTTVSENQIHGISISPKRVQEKNQTFNVIKIWNKDCTNYNKGTEIINLDKIETLSEIIYTPHIQKKL
jgi:hypothetical protein